MFQEIILMKIFSWYDLDEYEIEDGDTTGGDRKSNISVAFDNLGCGDNNNNKTLIKWCFIFFLNKENDDDFLHLRRSNSILMGLEILYSIFCNLFLPLEDNKTVLQQALCYSYGCVLF